MSRSEARPPDEYNIEMIEDMVSVSKVAAAVIIGGNKLRAEECLRPVVQFHTATATVDLRNSIMEH